MNASPAHCPGQKFAKDAIIDYAETVDGSKDEKTTKFDIHPSPETTYKKNVKFSWETHGKILE